VRTLMLHCVAVCCSVLQCVSVCCSVLQCVDQRIPRVWWRGTSVRTLMLQCVAASCSVLQCVAVCRSVLTDDSLNCGGRAQVCLY